MALILVCFELNLAYLYIMDGSHKIPCASCSIFQPVNVLHGGILDNSLPGMAYKHTLYSEDKFSKLLTLYEKSYGTVSARDLSMKQSCPSRH